MFTCCGPFRLLRPQLPYWPGTVLMNAAGLSQTFRSRIRQNGLTPATQLSRLLCGTKLVPAESHEVVSMGSAALQRGDGAELPAAHDLVDDAAVIEEALALAERQRVEDGRDEAMRHVEAWKAVVAGAAAHILGSEIICPAADGAAVVQRFRPGVAEQRGEIRAEALASILCPERVVVADAVRLQELDSRHTPDTARAWRRP